MHLLHHDLKLYTLNGLAFIVGFSDVDFLMKIILSALAIAYTIRKWYLMEKRKTDD